jgi:hypothetical protein
VRQLKINHRWNLNLRELIVVFRCFVLCINSLRSFIWADRDDHTYWCTLRDYITVDKVVEIYPKLIGPHLGLIYGITLCVIDLWLLI